tara:strand:- start:63 stop:440 length:378 start_codon:yes stop_codon:yes gene_type:complete
MFFLVMSLLSATLSTGKISTGATSLRRRGLLARLLFSEFSIIFPFSYGIEVVVFILLLIVLRSTTNRFAAVSALTVIIVMLALTVSVSPLIGRAFHVIFAHFCLNGLLVPLIVWVATAVRRRRAA